MIQFDKHNNLNCIVLESEKLRVKILPELGFKMASLVYKEKNKEILFQPTDLKYSIPKYKDAFEKYDTSGLDEMIPTIDKCIVNDIELPDHGDVWSIPWDVEVSDNEVIGRVKLRSFPLEFEKKISFSKSNIIKMDYRVKNPSNGEVPYLWALHGLNKFDDNTEIIFPEGTEKLLDVRNNKTINKEEIDDLKDLSKYKDKESYKLYILGKLSKGKCGLYYKDLGLKYIIKFDKKINPYLGIWITKGGFKGEYNCALEPSNGFYDSLELAMKNNRYASLKSFEEKYWTVHLEINEV